jgi:DNA repair exonuclease SbcCD ATPase subunit
MCVCVFTGETEEETRQQVQQLQQQLEDAEQHLDEVVKQLRDQKRQLADVETARETAVAAQAGAERKAEALEAQLMDVQQQCAALESQVADAQRQREELQAQLSDTEQQLHAALQRVAGLESGGAAPSSPGTASLGPQAAADGNAAYRGVSESAAAVVAKEGADGVESDVPAAGAEAAALCQEMQMLKEEVKRYAWEVRLED